MSDSLPQESAGDDGGSVEFDLPCLRCGYNLRTLRVSGACPECGEEVGWTARMSSAARQRWTLCEIRTISLLLGWLVPALIAGTIAVWLIDYRLLPATWATWLIVFTLLELVLLLHVDSFIPGSKIASPMIAVGTGVVCGLVLLVGAFRQMSTVTEAIAGTGLVLAAVIVQLRVVDAVLAFCTCVRSNRIAVACSVLRAGGLVCVLCGYASVWLMQSRNWNDLLLGATWSIAWILLPIVAALYSGVMLTLARRLRMYRAMGVADDQTPDA